MKTAIFYFLGMLGGITIGQHRFFREIFDYEGAKVFAFAIQIVAFLGFLALAFVLLDQYGEL